MQYELYEQIICDEHSTILFRFESNNILTISSYIESFPTDNISKYIIVNNSPANPINYSQLGFKNLPTEEEFYDIIFECKLSKERHYRIKESDFDECCLNNGLIVKISNDIFTFAKLQTEIYFERYNILKY